MSSAVRSRWDAFRELCYTRFLEFFRESEVVFWSFIFPIILSVFLGIAFRNRPAEISSVAVVGGAGAEDVAVPLRKTPLVHPRVEEEAQARSDLRMGRVDLVVSGSEGGGLRYVLDPARPGSLLARLRVDEALQRAAGRLDPIPSSDVEATEPGGRYIDFLIPGIMGMNLMSGGMWGVGFNLVDMRIKRLLKRLLATPMRRADFLLAQMTIRILAMAIEFTFLLGFGRLAFGVPVRGSLFSLALIGILGALCFGGMGLLVACRARKIEGVVGLMNVVMMPMFVCSGVFFSSERFPQAVQPLIRALPLTAVNDALRAVILEGAPLIAQSSELVTIAAWAILSFAFGLKFFRWHE